MTLDPHWSHVVPADQTGTRSCLVPKHIHIHPACCERPKASTCTLTPPHTHIFSHQPMFKPAVVNENEELLVQIQKWKHSKPMTVGEARCFRAHITIKLPDLFLISQTPGRRRGFFFLCLYVPVCAHAHKRVHGRAH